MSYNIRNIREISNDPLTKFVNQIAKKFARFQLKSETDKLENKEDIYSNAQDVDVALKFNSLGWTNRFDGSVQYFPTFEPDLQYNTCWIKGINVGNETRDLSEFGNVATIIGDPVLLDGTPFDLGISIGGVGSTCVRYNRPTSFVENEEHISIPDAINMQLSGISTGISYFIRFRIHDLSQQDGRSRTLFEKIDDSTPNNGVMLCVTSDGRLRIYVKRAGTEYKKETDADTIATNVVYEVWVTYDVSGNTIHVYVNNVDKTLTTNTEIINWHVTLSNHDTSIFRRGEGSDGGHVYGDFYDFMVEKERIVSAAQVGYHYNNKWTTADIPYGQCMITNYWATYSEIVEPPIPGTEEPSYTDTSYTSISYTTEGVATIMSFSSASFSSSSFKT